MTDARTVLLVGGDPDLAKAVEAHVSASVRQRPPDERDADVGDVDCIVCVADEYESVLDRANATPIVVGIADPADAERALSRGATDVVLVGGDGLGRRLATRARRWLQEDDGAEAPLARSIPVLILDEDGTITNCNETFEDEVGVPPSALVGDHIRDHVVTDEDTDAVLESVIEEKGVAQVLLRAADRLTQVTMNGIETDDDVVIEVRDFELELREEELQEHLLTLSGRLLEAGTREEVATVLNEVMRDAFEGPPSGTRFYEPDLHGLPPTHITSAAVDLMGVRPIYPVESSGPGKAFRTGQQYISPTVEDDLFLREAVDATLYTPIGDHGVLNFAVMDAEEFDEAVPRLLQIFASNAANALDRIEYENKLQAERTELERQNERLENFARFVSHDLRSPLAVVIGRLTLADRASDDERRKHHVTEALKAADRVNELIDDMLAYAREGQRIGSVEPASIETVARRAWQTVETREAAIEFDGVGRLWADESRLRQLFENLFRNAVEHVGEDVTVRVGVMEDGFYVEDDGPGIPSEKRDDVVDPGHTSTEDGTGFGLAIVNEIAAAHGWRMAVDEGDDGGARFEFTTDAVAI